jgi:hypothetical protein
MVNPPFNINEHSSSSSTNPIDADLDKYAYDNASPEEIILNQEEQALLGSISCLISKKIELL